MHFHVYYSVSSRYTERIKCLTGRQAVHYETGKREFSMNAWVADETATNQKSFSLYKYEQNRLREYAQNVGRMRIPRRFFLGDKNNISGAQTSAN